MQPIEQACFWLARRAPAPGSHSLEGAQAAEVAIVAPA